MATTQIQDISSTKKKLDITVDNAEVAKCLKKAYQKVGQQAKINGFRPGKIPTNILDKHYRDQIDYECLNFIISDNYIKALQDNNLIPVAEPKFDTKPLNRDTDYVFGIEVEIRPQFDLKDYKGIEIKKQEAAVTDEEIAEELKRLQESLAQLAPAAEDAKVAKGLVCTIDFDGTIDGKSFDGGSAKDYLFEFGNGTLLKDFEKNLEGLKPGDDKEFTMTFPQDYFEKPLAGKEASYKVTLKSLHNKNLPELDDEMAKDIGKESLEQVKTEIKDSILQRKEGGFRREYAETIREKLKKDYDFEVPQSIVDAEAKNSKQEPQEIEQQLRIELVLDTIAQQEGIQATPQDLQNHMMALSQIYRQPLPEIQKIYQDRNMMASLASQVVIEKTIDFLIENAKMV